MNTTKQASFNLEHLKKYFIKTLLVSLGMAAALGILAILTGSFGEIELKILVTTVIFGVYSILSLCDSLQVGKKYQTLALVGVGLNTVSLVIALALVWGLLDWGSTDIEPLVRIMGVAGVVGFGIAHSSLLLLLAYTKNKSVRQVLWSTITVITLVAAMLVAPIAIPDFDGGELYWRVLGALAILDVLGTITAPVLAKISK